MDLSDHRTFFHFTSLFQIRLDPERLAVFLGGDDVMASTSYGAW